MSGNLEEGVRHDVVRHRYELDVDGGLAVAEYYESDGARVFTHTEVPGQRAGVSPPSWFAQLLTIPGALASRLSPPALTSLRF